MDNVAAWRKQQRAALVARRMDIDPDLRRQWNGAIEGHLRRYLAALPPGILGSYWPIRGEFDPRPLATELLGHGWRIALPVVAKERAPLIFRLWTALAEMERGIWNIPVPRDGAIVLPTILLSPLVGFDEAKYRLGNGGGYFDRTLAAMEPRPQAIGVGFELGRLPTIHPQPYDVPMNVIVTEAGLYR